MLFFPLYFLELSKKDLLFGYFCKIYFLDRIFNFSMDLNILNVGLIRI